MSRVCEACGKPVQVGMWYACPHEWVTSRQAQDMAVTWPGGRTFENLGHDPVTFYSASEYRRHLRTHGIEEAVRHVPVPGSDKSPYTTSWAAVSQETLDGATAMLERVGQGAKAPARTWVERMDWTVTEERGVVHRAD